MRHRLGVLVVIGVLAACGGGDDALPADDAAAAGGDQTDGNGDTADDTADNDSGNSRSVSDLGDIPDECRKIMGDFLREIEPLLSGIDWDNATLADLEDLGTSIDAPSSDIEVELADAGCDDLDFEGDDDRGYDLAIELAKQEAPGTVGWLEFIREVSASFDSSGVPVESADAPKDCDGAVEAIRELMSGADSMSELKVDEFRAASSILQSVTTLCSIDEMTTLFDDQEFQEWTGG